MNERRYPPLRPPPPLIPIPPFLLARLQARKLLHDFFAARKRQKLVHDVLSRAAEAARRARSQSRRSAE
jgi:hypothetical protein